MESLKDSKQLANILHVKPGAIIFDITDILIFFDDTANFNNCGFFGSCEFDGIRQEINQNLAKHCLIATNRGKRFDVQLQRPLSVKIWGQSLTFTNLSTQVHLPT
jgi:hypothetical protein